MIIAIPIWGGWYRDVFTHWALPALTAAIDHAKINPLLVIHTNIPQELEPHLEGLHVEFRPLKGQGYEAFGDAHRDVYDQAPDGETVVFLAADLVLSIEALSAVMRRLETHRIVMCSGTRTLSDYGPPEGMDAAALHAWSWSHRHPITQDLIWPMSAAVPSMIYFECGDTVSLRSFHMHPLACIKDRPISFGVTVDADLPSAYTQEETHIVSDPRELCMVECSPIEKRFPRHEAMGCDAIASWAWHYTNDRHRWFFKNRTIIKGSGVEGFDESHATAQILARLGIA